MKTVLFLEGFAPKNDNYVTAFTATQDVFYTHFKTVRYLKRFDRPCLMNFL